MTTYTIELTDVEVKAMEYISTDVHFWIQNAAKARASIAADELVQLIIADKFAKNEPISGTRDEMILASTLPDANARNAIQHAAIADSMANMLTPPQE